MKNKERKNLKFQYRPRTAESIRRSVMIATVDDAIYRAHKRDAEPLLKFLRSNIPLRHIDRFALADLIERFVQHKQHGKRGKAAPTAAAEAQARFISRCRRDLERLREQNGGRLPKGAVRQTIQIAAQAEEFDNEPIDGEAAYVAISKQR